MINDKLKMRKMGMMRIMRVLGLVGFVGLLGLVSGCTTVREVVVTKEHMDTLYVDRWMRDSIYLETEKHDSVIVREKGDSVIVERWRTEWRDRWRDRVVHDSVYISKTDTVKEVVTETRPARNELTWWQRVRMTVGEIAMLVGFVLLVVWWVKIWLKR